MFSPTSIESSSQTTAADIEKGIRATVKQALESGQAALKGYRNISLAVLSSADRENLVMYPAEEQIIPSSACTRKRNEFTLGREAVRRAVMALGVDYVPVLRGGYGQPLWSAGIVGSITHCSPWSVALVARTGRSFPIGIDLESLERAGKVDISRQVCTGEELDWVHDGVSFSERVSMIFSAKEAVYKGFYPFHRQYIDFKDVELSWIPERQSFRISFIDVTKARFAAPRGCEVHCRCFNGLVFSCMVHDAA